MRTSQSLTVTTNFTRSGNPKGANRDSPPLVQVRASLVRSVETSETILAKSAGTASPPQPSRQPQAAPISAPPFFRPEPGGKIFGQLLGIVMAMHRMGAHKSYSNPYLIFPHDSWAKKAKEFFKNQQPQHYAIYEIVPWRSGQPFAGGFHTEVVTASFDYHSSSPQAAEFSAIKYTKESGLILLRELEKIVATTNVPKFYWDVDAQRRGEDIVATQSFAPKKQ